jgi:SNF2 family DNA or RNA helicase
MLVFHLTINERGRAYLWAEDSTLPVQQPPKPGRPPNVPDPREHPFAASTETLRSESSDVNPLVDSTEFTETSLTLLFPSGRFGPQSSPKLVRDKEMDAPIDRVSPWIVPALEVDTTALVDVLDAIADKDAGTVPGDTIQYWQTVASLAGEFVRSGRVVPNLEIRDGTGVAVWCALPSSSEDFDRLQSLRESMPPLARAIVTDEVAANAAETGWEQAEVPSARDILVRTIDVLVDAFARSRLTSIEAERPEEDIHRKWLAALAQPDGTIDAPTNELEGVHQELDSWTQSLQTPGEQDVRLCFRLRPPDPDLNLDADADTDGTEEAQTLENDLVSVSSDGWELELLLQAADEPSLLVEATTVWESTGTTMEVLERHLEHPQEILLEELGRAVPLFPQIEEALEEAKPTKLHITADEANEFLRETAEVLDQSGFGVIVPAWWNEPERRLGAKLNADSDSSTSADSSGGGIGVDQLCDFRWEVVLGGEPLSRAELEELAALKMPLVRVRGQWVSLRQEDIENALDLYDETDEGEMTVAEALQTGSDLAASDPGLPVVDHEFEGALEQLFDADLDEWIDDAETPERFDGQLRPYQKRGLGWLGYLEELGFGGCLADDMGLGKTIQILARLVEERNEGEPPGPTLVICPLSVVGNWKHEAHEFAPNLRVYVHHGTDRTSSTAFEEAMADHDLIVTTYGVVRNDIDQLREYQFHRVVLDEAQKIKNRSANRTQAVRALAARHRVALTGTPVENQLSELWSIMDFLNPRLLGSETSFRETIAQPIERYGDERTAEQLRRLTRPFILRRNKTDETIIDDLPEKVEIKEYCNLSEEQATLYKAATDELMEEIEQSDDMERRGQVLQLINALKTIYNHPRQYHQDGAQLEERSGKLERLESLAAEILDAGDRALIFTQYTSMAELIRHYLQEQLGRRVLYLHGGTPKNKRDEMVEQFQSPDGPPFFLLSLRAGGTGLTLTAANHVIHYDRWWNPAVEDQATDRTFRIGQTEDVQVRKLICEGTLEETIDETIERKRNLADQVLTDNDEWMTELSNDELRELVTLSEETLA